MLTSKAIQVLKMLTPATGAAVESTIQASFSRATRIGAHVAVVEVDADTGKVTHLRHIACDDAGTILNPMLLTGQVHGGIAQGTAQALYEEVCSDADGNPITSNLAEYAMITTDLMPDIERVPMETATWVNELGAKGIGESGTIGSTPAVHSAVIDALSHLGVRHCGTHALAGPSHGVTSKINHFARNRS